MHCSYFGQILQTVWPHPVIEGSGKNRLVMFISITDGALSFSLSQVQKLSWYSNEIIYHCEEKSILYNFLFRQWWNKSVKTFIYYCIRVIFRPSTLTVSPPLEFAPIQLCSQRDNLRHWHSPSFKFNILIFFSSIYFHTSIILSMILKECFT